MAYNFLACDRDQAFLPPPDLRDWLPADHLAWFILDVVDQLDLGPFLAAYRADGHGRAAYDPQMLLGVLLYAYCTGIRSSRQIERRCTEDIAFRVLAGNTTPDHVTIARFRVRHEQALAGLLIQSLRLCAVAGMVRLGLVALDGTKIEANAAERANRTHANLEEQVAELLAQAAEADRVEDQQHGAARGDQLPQALAGRAERLARLQRAKALLEAEAAARQQRYHQRVTELAAAARARGQRPRAHIRPRRRDEAPNPKATANTTDPDSRFVRGNGRTLQGYNAQAAATTEQVVVAAELTQQANDVQQLAPMLTAIRTTLTAAGICEPLQRLAADAGYWSTANVSAIPDAPELPIPPARHGRHGSPAGTASRRRPRATACGRRCGPGWTAPRARPTTPSAAGPSSRSSGRSRQCRAAGGSCAGGCGPARPSGSCCAAPTTCSSCGGTSPSGRSQRRPPPEPRARTARSSRADHQHGIPAQTAEVRQATGDPLMPPLGNTLCMEKSHTTPWPLPCECALQGVRGPGESLRNAR
jgi:transposase